MVGLRSDSERTKDFSIDGKDRSRPHSKAKTSNKPPLLRFRKHLAVSSMWARAQHAGVEGDDRKWL